MIRDPRRPAAGQDRRENRRVRRQRVDAGVDPQQRVVGKGPGVVAEQFLPSLGEQLGQVVDEPLNSHCVVWLERVLPWNGVPMVTTRRIEGLGSKKNVSCSFCRTSGSALICGSGSRLTSRQKASPLCTVCSREINPPML